MGMQKAPPVPRPPRQFTPEERALMQGAMQQTAAPDAAGFATRPNTSGSGIEALLVGALPQMLMGAIPGVGEAMDVRDFAQSARGGDKLGMGVAALSAALPFVTLGPVRRAMKNAKFRGREVLPGVVKDAPPAYKYKFRASNGDDFVVEIGERDGGALEIEWFGKDLWGTPRSTKSVRPKIGPGAVRDALDHIARDFPEARTVTWDRVSGAHAKGRAARTDVDPYTPNYFTTEIVREGQAPTPLPTYADVPSALKK